MAKRGNNKKDEALMNEVERAHLIVDKYIRNDNDRAELKKNMTPLFAQFLIRWITGNDFEMEERIVKIVMKKMQEIYVADNAAICKNVVDVVGSQLAEVLRPWNTRLQGIETSLKNLETGQTIISNKIDQIAIRVDNLETFEDKTIKELDYLKKTQGWRSIALRISLAVAISTIIMLIAMMIHSANSRKIQDSRTKIENTIR